MLPTTQRNHILIFWRALKSILLCSYFHSPNLPCGAYVRVRHHRDRRRERERKMGLVLAYHEIWLSPSDLVRWPNFEQTSEQPERGERRSPSGTGHALRLWIWPVTWIFVLLLTGWHRDSCVLSPIRKLYSWFKSINICKIPKHLIGYGEPCVIEEWDDKPNQEVCQLRSYGKEEISCHENPISRPPWLTLCPPPRCRRSRDGLFVTRDLLFVITT